jgi:hypothetical protein
LFPNSPRPTSFFLHGGTSTPRIKTQPPLCITGMIQAKTHGFNRPFPFPNNSVMSLTTQLQGLAVAPQAIHNCTRPLRPSPTAPAVSRLPWAGSDLRSARIQTSSIIIKQAEWDCFITELTLHNPRDPPSTKALERVITHIVPRRYMYFLAEIAPEPIIHHYLQRFIGTIRYDQERRPGPSFWLPFDPTSLPGIWLRTFPDKRVCRTSQHAHGVQFCIHSVI